MDDIGNKIASLMSDPNAMEQIKGIANMLGLDTQSNEKESGETSREEKVVRQVEEVVKQDDNNEEIPFLQGDTMQTIMGILPLLGEFNKEDDSKRLLLALKPFLSEERQKKVDEASKIISMIRLLPMLKTLNILG